MTERTDAFDVVGLHEQMAQLDRMMTDDPEMERKLREIIREVLKEARGELMTGASGGLQMQSDPRQAYKAIRSSVYRQVLGGNVNILSRRRAGSIHDWPEAPARTGRGGNRVKRGDRTKQLQGYWGADRGFILRFLNQGAYGRSVKTLGDKSVNGSGNRGSINARNWFGNASTSALRNASSTLTTMIEALIAERGV